MIVGGLHGPNAGGYSGLLSVLSPGAQRTLGLCSIPHSLDDELAHRLARQFGRLNGNAEAAIAEMKTLPIVYPYEDGWRVEEGAREVFSQAVAASREYADICGLLTRTFDEAAARLRDESARKRELQWRAAFHVAVANAGEAMERLDRFLQFADDKDRVSDFKAAATLCSKQAPWLATVQPDVAYFQGRYAYASGDYSSAAVLLQKVWEAGGRNLRWVTAGHLLAAMLRRAGGQERLIEAEKMLRSVLEVARLLEHQYSEAHVLTTLAATLRDRGGPRRLNEAEALARRALEIGVDHKTNVTITAITLGNVIIDQGRRERWSEALALFRLAHASARAWSQRDDLIAGAALSEGLLLRKLGEYKQAEERLRDAIARCPNEPEYRKQLAYTLIEMGEERFGEAEAELFRANELKPGDPSIKLHLRRVRSLLTAVKSRQEGRLEAGSAKEWLDLGKAFEHIRDFEQAVVCFEKATQQGPSGRNVDHRLGMCLARLGRYSEGAKHLEKAVTAGLRDRKTLTSLGRTLQKAGKGSEAEAYFLEALRKDPNETDATLRNWYGLWFLEFRRDFESAERHLRAALALQPSKAMLLNDVARLIIESRQRDKYSEARSLLKRAIELSGEELEWPRINLSALEAAEREAEPR